MGAHESLFEFVSWTWPLRIIFHRKRWFTVSIESPSQLTGFPHRVKAYDAEEAERKATYYWFLNCHGDDPWYEWHYEVLPC